MVFPYSVFARQATALTGRIELHPDLYELLVRNYVAMPASGAPLFASLYSSGAEAAALHRLGHAFLCSIDAPHYSCDPFRDRFEREKEAIKTGTAVERIARSLTLISAVATDTIARYPRRGSNAPLQHAWALDSPDGVARYAAFLRHTYGIVKEQVKHPISGDDFFSCFTVRDRPGELSVSRAICSCARSQGLTGALLAAGSVLGFVWGDMISVDSSVKLMPNHSIATPWRSDYKGLTIDARTPFSSLAFAGAPGNEGLMANCEIVPCPSGHFDECYLRLIAMIDLPAGVELVVDPQAAGRCGERERDQAAMFARHMRENHDDQVFGKLLCCTTLAGLVLSSHWCP